MEMEDDNVKPGWRNFSSTPFETSSYDEGDSVQLRLPGLCYNASYHGLSLASAGFFDFQFIGCLPFGIMHPNNPKLQPCTTRAYR